MRGDLHGEGREPRGCPRVHGSARDFELGALPQSLRVLISVAQDGGVARGRRLRLSAREEFLLIELVDIVEDGRQMRLSVARGVWVV